MTVGATHLSDINELATGYHLNRGTWWNAEVRDQFEHKSLLVRESGGAANVVIQAKRGKAQAECVRHQWTVAYGVPFTLSAIHWCARGDAIQAIIPTATPKHPADLIVEVDGRWLGISCKSRHGGESSGWKNPGLGTLARAFQCEVDLAAMVEDYQRDLRLDDTQDERKKAIRADPELQGRTREIGGHCVQGVRDALLTAAARLSSTQLADIVQHTLLDSADVYPPYVRVVGTGNTAHTFAATMHDPYRVPVVDLAVHKVGSAAIGITSGRSRICQIRLKWESEPCASTFKASVDPWT